MFKKIPFTKPRSEYFIIGLDVDMTLADTLTPWVNWCNRRLSYNDYVSMSDLDVHGTGKAIDIVPYMIERGIQNPLSFWEDPELYQKYNVGTRHGVVHMVSNLFKTLAYMGVDALPVIVTHCNPAHINSKKIFVHDLIKSLPSSIPDPIAFIDTEDKYLADLDLLIDDSFQNAQNNQAIGRETIVPWTPSADVSGTSLTYVLGSDYDCSYRHADLIKILEFLNI